MSDETNARDRRERQLTYDDYAIGEQYCNNAWLKEMWKIVKDQELDREYWICFEDTLGLFAYIDKLLAEREELFTKNKGEG